MMICERLVEGTDYAERGGWPVMLGRDVEIELPAEMGCGFLWDFVSGKHWLGKLRNGRLTIHAGYACDGYSPVVRLCGRFVRLTPTPAAGMLPAIWHDLARQFHAVPGCPWTRHQADEWFRDLLLAGGCGPVVAAAYFRAVAGTTGKIYEALTRRHDGALKVVRRRRG